MSAVLAVVCVVVALFHLARLAVRRRDVVGELAHALMGLGMAAMFSPAADPVPAPVWTVVFAAGLAWFGAGARRSGTLGGDAGHHVVGSCAMLLMLAAGHGAHTGVASLAALALTGYFAWHALRCVDRCRASGPVREPGGAAVAVRAEVRVFDPPQHAAAAHLVMAAAMTVMLLGMI